MKKKSLKNTQRKANEQIINKRTKADIGPIKINFGHTKKKKRGKEDHNRLAPNPHGDDLTYEYLGTQRPVDPSSTPRRDTPGIVVAKGSSIGGGTGTARIGL